MTNATSTKGATKMTVEKRKYLREYRQKNKVSIKKKSQARYLINREARIQNVKDWHKRNPEYNKNRMKRRYPVERELNLIRQKTKSVFSHLKVACIKCKKMNCHLEFHHLEPFAYDKFDILCRNCHRGAHGTLLMEMEDKDERL